jgi:outer membrane protein assembly factor BamB
MKEDIKVKSCLLFKIILILVIGVLVASCKKSGTSQSEAGQSVKITAIVKSVMGKASGLFGGSVKALSKGMEVTEAEYLKTEAGSKVTILFSTNSEIVLQENSKIAIKNILPKGINTHLNNGSILCNIKRLSNSEEFNVSSPTAIAGVRGTKFYVSYNAVSKTTRVSVKKGVVNVRPAVKGFEGQDALKINKAVSVDLESGRAISVSENDASRISAKLIKDKAKITESDASSVSSIQSVNEAKMLLKKYAGSNTRNDEAILNLITDTEENVSVNNNPGGASSSAAGEAQVRVIKEKKSLPRIASMVSVGVAASTPVYTFGGKSAFVGKDNVLYIVDFSQEQGSIFKKINLSSPVKSVPLLYGNMLYVGTINKKLYGVNITSGAVSFVTTLNEALNLQNSITASGSDIYLSTGVQLYRINRFSGAKVWVKNIENGSWAAVAVDGENIYLGDEAGKVRAFSIANGTEKWSKTGGMRVSVGRVFTIDDKVVINMYRGGIKAYKSKDGTPVATSANVGTLQKAPVRHGNLVYYPLSNHIKVLDLKSLKVIGIIPTAGEPKFNPSGAKLYISSGSKIKSSSLFGRGEDWSVELDAAVSSNPAADEFYVYVLSAKGTLYKLNKRDFIMVEKTVSER